MPDPVVLGPIDVGIVRCLHADARRSVAGIASHLGVPESTIRHRLNRLVRRGIVEFAALTNPLQLGYQIWAIIEIQARLRSIRPVAQQLAAAPEVYFVGITTGGYDVLAAAVFRSNDELLDFITRRLSSIPGIVRTSTSSVLEVVKRSMTIPLPDTRVPSRPTPRIRTGRSPRRGRAAPGRGP
jgi:Lrp/AsnC family transcriptional regulator for asnA, asnC and gidA